MRGLAIAALIAAAAAPAAAAPQPTELERGVALFQARRYGDAVAPLAAAHAADPAAPDAALLLGIAYYQTGRPESARPLLEQAERGGGADAQASARVFLGLIADAAGDAERARGYYALVARSPTELGASGRRLYDRSRPEWSIAAILRPGVDSNVPLLPSTAVDPGPAAPRELAIGYVLARDATEDAALAATGHAGRIAARVRPWDGAELRAQLTAGAYLYDEAARRDLRVRGEATLFIDVSRAVGIVLGATALHNASSAADGDYAKWTAFAGLVVAASS